jgi:hypothetical protein
MGAVGIGMRWLLPFAADVEDGKGLEEMQDCTTIQATRSAYLASLSEYYGSRLPERG